MNRKNKIKIKLNGKYQLFDANKTVYDLINKLKISINKVAIEINNKIIDKKKVKKIILKNKDNIEIVHFIGGG
mgnify:CR=1 FL=1|jgi:sulfur carrier protein|tara:strand:- start:12065 stop:12283 length:219 start_codon:yes stop_codon:yes gene_type:complete